MNSLVEEIKNYMTSTLDISVHLVHKTTAEASDYLVAAKLGEYILLLIDADNNPVASDRENAAVEQEGLSRALFVATVCKAPPVTYFIKRDDKNVVVCMTTTSDTASKEYRLMPVKLVNKQLRPMSFMNATHASAYAGEILSILCRDALDWSKVVITDTSMTFKP